MLICVLCSFLICGAGDVEEAVDPRLYSIDTLIPQLKWLPRIDSVLVDHAIDEFLYGCNVLGGAKLSRISGKWLKFF